MIEKYNHQNEAINKTIAYFKNDDNKKCAEMAIEILNGKCLTEQNYSHAV